MLSWLCCRVYWGRVCRDEKTPSQPTPGSQFCEGRCFCGTFPRLLKWPMTTVMPGQLSPCAIQLSLRDANFFIHSVSVETSFWAQECLWNFLVCFWILSLFLCGQKQARDTNNETSQGWWEVERATVGRSPSVNSRAAYVSCDCQCCRMSHSEMWFFINVIFSQNKQINKKRFPTVKWAAALGDKHPCC